METGKYYAKNQERIAQLTTRDWELALDRCEAHIHWKLKERTLFGAHNESKLGEDPIDYYLSIAYEKIISGEWEWKTKFTLLEQMNRIVDSYISKSIEKTQTAKADALRIVYTDKDIEPLGDTETTDELIENEERFSKLVDQVDQTIKGDDELEKLFLYIKEGKDYDEISKLLNIDKNAVYRLNERIKYKLRQII